MKKRELPPMQHYKLPEIVCLEKILFSLDFEETNKPNCT
jgi:hypothetical protein